METHERVMFCLWCKLFLFTNTAFFIRYLMSQRICRTHRNRTEPTRDRSYSLIKKMPELTDHLRHITELSDVTCINNLRMDRNTFCRLSYLLEHIGGLKCEKFVSVPEKVSMFLSILAHHKKNRIIQTDFKRSGQTISKYFKETLTSLLRISQLLLVNQSPVQPTETNEIWRPFQGCLGALDGTFIEVNVPLRDQARYRNRKGNIAVNVLGVCNRDLNFIYVLSGWEGSAADSRVLRAALSKANGLRVPGGCYYLCDCGYTNAEGFLTPYRGTRYHLTDWRGGTRPPTNYMEYYNLKHSRARNVIERAFCLLKKRWAILRSPSFYPIKTQNRIILACALLHNFIRIEMEVDPLEEDLSDDEHDPHGDEEDFVATIDATPAWAHFRETFAHNLFNEWRGA